MVVIPAKAHQVYNTSTNKAKEISWVITIGAVFGGVIGYLTFLPVELCIVSAVALGLYNTQ